MSNNNRQIALPLIVAILLVAGLLMGDLLIKRNGNSAFQKNKLSSYQEIVEIIRANYVDNISMDSLQSASIKELLKKLDPHSYYLTAQEVKESNEELSGHFAGIGVEFNVFNDTATLTYIIPNGPAEKAGLMTGDKLLSANGKSLVNQPQSSDSIRMCMRGDQGTKVNVKVLRENRMHSYWITRASIPLPAIESAYLWNKQTGYIRLGRFSETSYKEFMQTLEPLIQNGIKNLILDLRGNGGGLLSEAVSIADEFIDNKKLIVYTEGSKIGKKEFRASRPGLFEKGNLAILIDGSSASASEVVAGAVQDWCRGKIIGQSSYGKGLVQEEFTLQNGAALRLTTARYYTPLGRCIQVPYGPTNKSAQQKPYFFTPCQDTLFASNGIQPTYPIFNLKDSVIYTSATIQQTLPLLTPFCFEFYQLHKKIVDKLSSPQELQDNPTLQSEIWKEWTSWNAATNSKTYTATEKSFIQQRMLATLARFKWRNNGYFQVLNANDPVIKKAVDLTQ
jgi:carboxyl-terminal processing protease